MSAEILYINNEKFGNHSYVGNREQWRATMLDCFKNWYRELCEEAGQDGADDDDVPTFEDYVDPAWTRALPKRTTTKSRIYPSCKTISGRQHLGKQSRLHNLLQWTGTKRR